MSDQEQVRVTMARSNIFHWQESCSFRATLKHRPSGPGDCFVLLPLDQPDTKLILNGNSTDFIGIEVLRCTTAPG